MWPTEHILIKAGVRHYRCENWYEKAQKYDRAQALRIEYSENGQREAFTSFTYSEMMDYKRIIEDANFTVLPFPLT